MKSISQPELLAGIGTLHILVLGAFVTCTEQLLKANPTKEEREKHTTTLRGLQAAISCVEFLASHVSCAEHMSVPTVISLCYDSTPSVVVSDLHATFKSAGPFDLAHLNILQKQISTLLS